MQRIGAFVRRVPAPRTPAQRPPAQPSSIHTGGRRLVQLNRPNLNGEAFGIGRRQDRWRLGHEDVAYAVLIQPSL
jgi:hypothetical protein